MQRLWWMWIGLVVACGSGDSKGTAKKGESERGGYGAPGGSGDDEVGGGPYDYRTWVKLLDDPAEAERAVTQLEQLGHPEAIKPLGEAWLKFGRPVRMLQVMIALARPLTAEEAKAQFLTDFETSGRKASWELAMPYLTRAIIEVDDANPRSIDSAMKAADALGEARLPAGFEALHDIAMRPTTKKLLAAQVAAVRALGKYSADKRASQALVKLVERDPVDDESREKKMMYFSMTGAAINALAELRDPSTVESLLIAMYRAPELLQQVRRALVSIGAPAKAELRRVLQGTHTEVERLFRDHKLDQYCASPTYCSPVSLKDFCAAIVLGDFYDPAVVDDLLAALARPIVPAYYFDDQPGPTQVAAVFDALRKTGAEKAAAPVRAMWRDDKAPTEVRALAASAYGFLARDTADVKALGAIAADNRADDYLRTEAATSYARLARDKADIALLDGLAKRYLDAAATKAGSKQAKKAAAAIAAADKRLEAEKRKRDQATTKLQQVMRDPNATAAQIQKQTQITKDADEKYRAAKKKHRETVAPYKQADSAATAYRGYARMFQAHIARVEVAVRCQQDVACYGETLEATPDDIAKHVAPYIKDVDSWSQDERVALYEAAVDRAMLELGKAGPAATQLTDLLLDHAKSDNRMVRQAILLALPKIAKLPCATCDAKLDAAIKAADGNDSLAQVVLDTKLVQAYFAAATP